MYRSATVRRLPAWLGVVLVATLLPLLAPFTPAAHAAECTSEEAPTMDPFPIPTEGGCDDVTPPETTLGATTPSPNGNGFISQKSVSFAFTGAHSDADSDPIAFECQFYATATAPTTWDACTSPTTYDELSETAGTPYTFRVRAVDTADRAIDLTADPFFPSDADAPDEDQSPASTTFKVDTVDPNVRIRQGPYDAEGTGWPILENRRATYVLHASEDNVSYRCQLDGLTVDCGQGTNSYGRLSGGEHFFEATVTDRAGNRDDSPATGQFIVPYNLSKSRNWSRKKARGYFARDYVQTRTKGAVVKLKVSNVREVRLIAPSGQGLGKVRVRVGNSFWTTVNLGRKKDAKRRTYQIRGPQAPLMSGTLQVQALRGLVRVDAVVLPVN